MVNDRRYMVYSKRFEIGYDDIQYNQNWICEYVSSNIERCDGCLLRDLTLVHKYRDWCKNNGYQPLKHTKSIVKEMSKHLGCIHMGSWVNWKMIKYIQK